MSLKQKLRFIAVVLILVVVLGALAFQEQKKRQDIVFAESLEMVAVTVDERELTLRDMAFYIAHQELEMEDMARIYNAEDTGEYWNLYTNHTFLRAEAKQSVMDIAIHDEIFYQLALQEEIELTAEEEAHLANDQYDFWSDLEEEQREALGVSEEVLKESMHKLALAEKYQYLLAEMNHKTYDDYAVGGLAYEKMLLEHTYSVNESVWTKIGFGSITVDH